MRLKVEGGGSKEIAFDTSNLSSIIYLHGEPNAWPTNLFDLCNRGVQNSCFKAWKSFQMVSNDPKDVFYGVHHSAIENVSERTL